MTTFYAALGDVDAEPETDTDDRAVEILTTALDEYDLTVEDIDVYAATDRSMALVTFDIDADVTATELSTQAGDAIGVADSPEPADEVLDAMQPHQRDCFATLSIRGFSPRSASCNLHE